MLLNTGVQTAIARMGMGYPGANERSGAFSTSSLQSIANALDLSLYVLSVSLVLQSSTNDSNLRLNPVFVVNHVCIATENAETTSRHPRVSVERHQEAEVAYKQA